MAAETARPGSAGVALADAAMGRGLMAAETLGTKRDQIAQLGPQWGRGLMAAETRSITWSSSARTPGRNGAAA